MAKGNDWKNYKVQGHGDDYFRMSLPTSYGARFERIECKEEGDYLIVRPHEEEKDDEKASETLPLTEKTLEQEEGITRGRILDTLQCYCIADVDRVTIELPDGTDENVRKNIDESCKEIEMPGFWEWKEDDFVFVFKQEFGFDDYIRNVQRFLDRYFLKTLTEERRVNLDEEKKNEIENDMSRDHRDIDKMWALSSRDATRTLFGLEVSGFPEATGKYFIGKYLEHVIDRANKCIESLHEVYLKADEETATKIQNRLQEIFTEPDRFSTSQVLPT